MEARPSWRPRSSPFPKAFARISKASTIMPPIGLTTNIGRYGEVGEASDGNVLGSFRIHHRARTDVDVHRNTERRLKPPYSGTGRTCFILSKPPKTKRSSIMMAEGDRLAKKKKTSESNGRRKACIQKK